MQAQDVLKMLEKESFEVANHFIKFFNEFLQKLFSDVQKNIERERANKLPPAPVLSGAPKPPPFAKAFPGLGVKKDDKLAPDYEPETPTHRHTR